MKLNHWADSSHLQRFRRTRKFLFIQHFCAWQNFQRISSLLLPKILEQKIVAWKHSICFHNIIFDGRKTKRFAWEFRYNFVLCLPFNWLRWASDVIFYVFYTNRFSFWVSIFCLNFLGNNLRWFEFIFPWLFFFQKNSFEI